MRAVSIDDIAILGVIQSARFSTSSQHEDQPDGEIQKDHMRPFTALTSFFVCLGDI